MISRLAPAVFILGSAIGVGSMYMSGRRRTALTKASKKIVTPEPVTAPANEAPQPQLLSREIAPMRVSELPPDLSLDEIYNRVSHA